MKTGWHEGLRYSNASKFKMDPWLKGDKADDAIGGNVESKQEIKSLYEAGVAGRDK